MKAVVTILLFQISSFTYAWESPRQALDEFLKFELNCGRCQSWPFDKYIVADKNYDEPGWDLINLIDKYDVLSFTCQENRCAARIKFYFSITPISPNAQVVAHPDGGNIVVTYIVIKHKGNWLLEKSGDDYPMVSLSSFKKLFQNEL